MLDRAARTSIVKLVIGLALVGLGVLALLGQALDSVFNINIWHGGRSTGGLAVPGSILSTIGVILFYQNLFDRFETWSYAWALILVAIGVGAMIHGSWSSSPTAWANGQRMAKFGLLLFLAFGVFFELIIGISGFRGGAFVWPLLLIGFGVYLVLRQTGLRRFAVPAGLPTTWTPQPPNTDRPEE
jgi:hypothetical protein